MARVQTTPAARPSVVSPQPPTAIPETSLGEASADESVAAAAPALPSAPPQQGATISAAAAPSTPRAVANAGGGATAGASPSAMRSMRRSASSMSVAGSNSNAPGPSTPHSRAAAYGLLARASPPPVATTSAGISSTHTPRRPSLLFAPASLAASSSSPTPSPRDATPPPPFLPAGSQQPQQRGRGVSAAAALASQHLGGGASSAASNLFGFEVTALRPFGSPAPGMSTWRPPHAPAPAPRLSAAAAQQPTSGSPRFNHLGGNSHFNAAQAPASRPTSAPWPWSNTYGAPHLHAHQQQQQAPQHGAQHAWSALADPSWHGAAGIQAPGRTFEENSITSFTWRIGDLALLRDEVEQASAPLDGDERSVSAGGGMSDVWTTQPIWGDGKWKLELVRTSRSAAASSDEDDEGTASASSTTVPLSSSPISLDHPSGTLAADTLDGEARTLSVLSVYLTSMVLDYSPADYAIPASIFLGISPAGRSPATRASRGGGFVWTTHASWEFARETEFWQCHSLPALSALLEDEEISSRDAMELTVQISVGPRAGSGAMKQMGRMPFEMETLHAVPRDLVAGLEGLLDSQSTGDVVLLVRECGVLLPAADGESEAAPRSEVRVLQMGAPMPPGATLLVRDRAIWAHSALLRVRSDFFRDMLDSAFCEGQERELDAQESEESNYGAGGAGGQEEGMTTLAGRKVRVLRLPDADFATAYALVRFLYLDEVQFAAAEPLHSGGLDESWLCCDGLAATSATAGEGDASPLPVWEWRVCDEEEEVEYVQRHEAATQAGADRTSYGMPAMHPHAAAATRQSAGGRTSLGDVATSTATTAASEAAASTSAADTWPRGALRRPGEWRPISSYAELQRQQQQQQQHVQPDGPSRDSHLASSPPSLGTALHSDPHSHPPQHVQRPSALALYRLAHRCGAGALASLARAHLVAALRPSNAFPLLLATGRYEELHAEVKRYVLLHWEAVASTEVFDRCIREAFCGDWGTDAATAVLPFLKALRSPAMP